VKLNRFLDALAWPVAKLLDRREDVLPFDGVDYVIGFGIGMRARGKPSLLSEGVARRCAELFKAGLAKNIIFAGGLYECHRSPSDEEYCSWGGGARKEYSY